MSRLLCLTELLRRARPAADTAPGLPQLTGISAREGIRVRRGLRGGWSGPVVARDLALGHHDRPHGVAVVAPDGVPARGQAGVDSGVARARVDRPPADLAVRPPTARDAGRADLDLVSVELLRGVQDQRPDAWPDLEHHGAGSRRPV